jgi:hypothetical protein
MDAQLLLSALSTIHEDESGRPFSSGRFDKLLVDLHASFIQEENRYKDIFFQYEHSHKDVWNLETMIQRSAWQKWLVTSGNLPDDVVVNYIACDIDLFHVQYRSLLDRLAKIVGLLSGRPHVVPDSFRKLKEWLRKPGNSQRIDGQLAQFISSCHWFDGLREIRDSIVHRYGRTTVSLKGDKIFFQVRGLKNDVPLPKAVFNDDLVDFELYSGLMMGYLFGYLENLAAITREKLKLKEYDVEPRNFHGGLRFIRHRIQSLVESHGAI